MPSAVVLWQKPGIEHGWGWLIQAGTPKLKPPTNPCNIERGTNGGEPMTRSSLLFIFGLACCSAWAHHSTVGVFDTSQTIEVTGTVVAVSWRNPHGQIVLAGDDGREWHAETSSISVLRNRGAAGDSINVGDHITIAGSPPVRDVAEILARNVLLPSGYEFDFGSGNPYFAAGRSGNLVGRLTEETDVSQAVAQADGIFRVWSTVMSDPDSFPMFKGDYPMTPAAEAALAAWDPLDNELLLCGTKAMPLIMITPFPIDFVRQSDDILMRIEEFDARRIIHMADDAVAPAEHTQFGFSRGRWEGTTLVVETDRIHAHYMDMDGAPHSDQITLVERFVPNEDYSRLDYRITITDPVYYSEPFELTRYFIWRPEMRVHQYECLERY